jgi:coenzyme Q-binding protein COQ10
MLPYQPAQLFALVGDVERYPEFVPWVTRLRIWNRRPDGEGVTLLDAEAEVGFSLIHERFPPRAADERSWRSTSI